jgi:hypothetical protein
MTDIEKQIINNQTAIFNLLGYLTEIVTGKKISVMMEIEPWQIVDIIPNVAYVKTDRATEGYPVCSVEVNAKDSQPPV